MSTAPGESQYLLDRRGNAPVAGVFLRQALAGGVITLHGDGRPSGASPT